MQTTFKPIVDRAPLGVRLAQAVEALHYGHSLGGEFLDRYHAPRKSRRRVYAR